MPNLYETLGLKRSADEKEIRQAYRRLARQHHPDVNPGDPDAAERFKSINAAYEVLSDSDKRAKYDRYGDQWEHAEQFEQRRGAGPDFSQSFRSGDFGRGRGGSFTFSTGGGSLDDLLGSFGRGGAPFRSPPTDVPVDITLEEADHGATRLVSLPDGRRLEVTIPPGISDGGRVHIGAGNPSGSEFNLLVSVLPHHRFERDGPDLYTSVDVPLADAILGGSTKVTTLRGQIELTLPPETQNGRRFRLAGQGLSQLRNPDRRGNLFATINVVLPTGLSEEQRQLFEQFRESVSANHSSDNDWDNDC